MPSRSGYSTPRSSATWKRFVCTAWRRTRAAVTLPRQPWPPTSTASFAARRSASAAALLTGMAFFVLGSSHWGWFYAFGLAFFALSLVMPLRLEWATLEFGLLWAAALLVIGLQLRRLGRMPEGRSPGEDAAAGTE